MEANPCSVFLLGVGTTCAKSVVLSPDFMSSGGAAPLSSPASEQGGATSSSAAKVSFLAGAAVLGAGVLWFVAKGATPVLANPLAVRTAEETAQLHVEDMRDNLLDKMWDWLRSPTGPPGPGIALALRDAGVSQGDVRKYYDPAEPRTRLGSGEIQRRGMEQIEYANGAQIVRYYRGAQ